MNIEWQSTAEPEEGIWCPDCNKSTGISHAGVLFDRSTFETIMEVTRRYCTECGVKV